MTPVLHTARLKLRALTSGDFEPVRETLMSDRARFMSGPFDLAGAWQEFCMEVAGWVLNGCGGWAIERNDSGGFAGIVALTIRPDFPEPELGWILQADAEGQGIAFEAAGAARRFAFGTLGWRTLVSYVDPGNARSIRLAERLGATLDQNAAKPEPGDLVYRHPAPEALQ